MTPPGRSAGPRPALSIVSLVGGLAALLLLFSPYDDPDAHRLSFDLVPAAEAIAVATSLGILGALGLRLGRVLRSVVAALVLAAGLVGLLDAIGPTLLGRQIELYWDVRHVPGLIGLVVDSFGAARAAAIFAGAALALVAGWGAVALALAALGRGFADRRVAAAGAALGCLLLAVGLAFGDRAGATSLHAGDAIGRNAAAFYRGWQIATGRANPYSAALAAPALAQPDLERLAGRDVYLIFIESYGTALLDRPDFAAKLAPAFDRFEDRLSKAGYALASHRILSPTYGGGSWLAHAAVASGIDVSDPFLYRLLVGSGRKTFATAMAEAGYRTVEVMPGMKSASPEDAWRGFATRLYAADLDYDGPPFGWFRIPDQFTLGRVSEIAAAGGRPLFLEAVLVSSHTPFAPVPPYVADWPQGDLYSGVAQDEWDRIYAAPDWAHLERPYLESVAYDLDTLAGWLERLPGNALVVLLGDHQPPAFVIGGKQPWTVPIHVVSRDRALVGRFEAQGYTRGARPRQPGPWPHMAGFMRDFFAAVSRDPPVIARGGAAHGTAPN